MSAGLRANVAIGMPALRGVGSKKRRYQGTASEDEPFTALLRRLPLPSKAWAGPFKQDCGGSSPSQLGPALN